MKEILITGVIILFCLAAVNLYCHITYVETMDDVMTALKSGDKEKAKRIRLELIKKDPAQRFMLAQSILSEKERGIESMPINKEEAINLIHKSAEQGFPPAQYVLGKFYLEGSGVPQDYAKAYFWLNIAASQDKSYAEFREKAGSNLSIAKREEIQEMCGNWVEEFKKQKPVKDQKQLNKYDVNIYEWLNWRSEEHTSELQSH